MIALHLLHTLLISGGTSITTNSVSLSWQKYEHLDSAQFISYKLDYRKKLVDSPNQILTTEEATSNNKTIIGLEAGQSYQVRISIKTIDFGDSSPSNWYDFQTLDTSEEDENVMDNRLTALVSNFLQLLCLLY